MPTKVTPENAVDVAADTAAKISADAQKAISDAAKRIEIAVQQGLEQVRSQSRVYADAAGEQLDEASRLASEQIRARPLAATGLALGVGVLIGLLLAPGVESRSPPALGRRLRRHSCRRIGLRGGCGVRRLCAG